MKPWKYLIGQNFGGQNCRNFELVPKFLSDMIIPSYTLHHSYLFAKNITHFSIQLSLNLLLKKRTKEIQNERLPASRELE